MRIKFKRFLSIWISAAAIIVILALFSTIIMNYYSVYMDLMFGRGARHIFNTAESAEWDTNYYDVEVKNAEEALLHGVKLTEEIADEGIALLKNNGILPLEKNSTVTPFGYRFIYPNYGPSGGSARFDFAKMHITTAEEALLKKYKLNYDVIDKMKTAVPQGMDANQYFDYLPSSGKRGWVVEYDPTIYIGTEASCEKTVGMVFLGRQGREGAYDLTTKKLFDGTPHAVAFSEYEMKAIKFAKENCDSVVVIINGCNPMQLPMLTEKGGEYEADAIVWIGGPGSSGFLSLAKILSGEINPSGRLVDIFASDFGKSPIVANYGSESKYSNVETDSSHYIYNTFVEYEEGIYNGYRYYETADAVDPAFVYGKVNKYGETTEPGEVVYPFGYGLSYSSFEKHIVDFDTNGNSITVKVKVTNTGTIKGKEAVQVYYTAPYTQFSVENRIEKSVAVLIGFGKTKELAAGESDEINIEFATEDMASYCDNVKSNDGTQGCYVLEKGEYIISLRDNSHDIIDTKSVNIPKTILYDNENPRQTEKKAQSYLDADGTIVNIPAKQSIEKSAQFVAATNRFEYMSDYMYENATVLTRSNWQNSQPSPPDNFIAPESVLAEFENNKGFDPLTDKALGDIEGSNVYNNTNVTEKQKNGLTLADLRGLDYYDPLWDELLDQLDYSSDDVLSLLSRGYMQTNEVKSVGKPATNERDGPLGLTANSRDVALDAANHCYYCAAPIVAATFNVNLAYQFGKSVAQESILNANGELPISGWYAPGVNIHRGPFGSRYYEYLSEDPLLSGIIAAGISEGCADSGVYVIIKHFAANNQDAGRTGLNTWMTEQALREIYLKPYEICIKNAKTSVKYIKDAEGTVGQRVISATRGIMTAKNSLGNVFCGANYSLNTEVLRNEWAFHGMVVSDKLDRKAPEFYSKMVRSGNDVLMTSRTDMRIAGLESNTGKHVTRQSIHEICFMVASSNAMQGAAPGALVYYDMSPWAVLIMVVDIIVGIAVLAMSIISVVIYKKQKRR